MLYLTAFVLGLIVGRIFNGKFFNFVNIRFEKVYLVVIALGTQIASRVLIRSGLLLIDKYNTIIPVLTCLIILVAFWYNRHYKGVVLIGLGMALNSLIMVLNSGKMPVACDALVGPEYVTEIEFLKTGSDARHTLLNEYTKLWFLGDVIQLPGFLGWSMRVISVGDLIITAGVFVIGFEGMRSKK